MVSARDRASSQLAIALWLVEEKTAVRPHTVSETDRGELAAEAIADARHDEWTLVEETPHVEEVIGLYPSIQMPEEANHCDSGMTVGYAMSDAVRSREIDCAGEDLVRKEHTNLPPAEASGLGHSLNHVLNDTRPLGEAGEAENGHGAGKVDKIRDQEVLKDDRHICITSR